MSRRGSSSSTPYTLLLVVGLLIAVTVAGPTMALAFKLSFMQSMLILAPIIGPIVLIGTALLIFKMYWQRYW